MLQEGVHGHRHGAAPDGIAHEDHISFVNAVTEPLQLRSGPGLPFGHSLAHTGSVTLGIGHSPLHAEPLAAHSLRDDRRSLLGVADLQEFHAAVIVVLTPAGVVNDQNLLHGVRSFFLSGYHPRPAVSRKTPGGSRAYAKVVR